MTIRDWSRTARIIAEKRSAKAAAAGRKGGLVTQAKRRAKQEAKP